MIRRVVARASIGGLIAVVLAGTIVLLGFVPTFGTGIDERMYRDATERWLAGGWWYLPHQLAGPYPATMGDVMYPPVTLWLFVPMALTPPQWWYVGPILLIAWSLYRMRPAWWAWPVLLVIAASPWAMGYWMFGNPKMWLLALAFVLLAHGWRWWLATAVLALIGSLAVLPMWPDYFTATGNARDLGYQWSTLILFALALVARLGARRDALPRPGAAPGGDDGVGADDRDRGVEGAEGADRGAAGLAEEVAGSGIA